MDAFTLPAAWLPYTAIGPWETGFVFLIYAAGFFIRGAFGFGSNMPIVLLTTWVLGPHHAIFLVAVTAAVAQVHMFPAGVKTADWGIARPMFIGMLIGTACGTWMLSRLDAEWLTLTMGGLITMIVIIDRYHLLERLSERINLRARPVTASLALTSGVLGSVSGGGGIYFMAPYLKLVCPTPTALRGTNLVLSGLFMMGRIVFIALLGLLTPNLFIETLLLLPAVALGIWAGTRFFRTATPERFYAALQLLLAMAAVVLMLKGAKKIF